MCASYNDRPVWRKSDREHLGPLLAGQDLRPKSWSPDSHASIEPYVAPHTAKIHTLITLGVSILAKPLVLKARKRVPRGFDSHRPLHFWLPGVSPRCPGTRLSLSPNAHSLDAATTVPIIECVDRPLGRVRSRWSNPSVIDPLQAFAGGSYVAPIHIVHNHQLLSGSNRRSALYTS
jgi:hypothetical protein